MKRPEALAATSGRVEHFAKRNGADCTHNSPCYQVAEPPFDYTALPPDIGTEEKKPAARIQAARRLRRQHLARQVHRLGARVFFEFVDELDRVHRLGDDLDRRLERYGRLDRDLLHWVGGDRFAAGPLRAVGGSR